MGGMKLPTIQGIDPKSRTDSPEVGRISSLSFHDRFGPESVTFFFDIEKGIEGILVIDNTVLGPGSGCIMFSPTINPIRVFEWARIRTLTSALMNLNLGGATTGIVANSSRIDKIDFLRILAKKLQPYIPERYILAPSSVIGKNEIAEFVKEIGNLGGATGKPEEMGGIPREIGIEGFGIGIAIVSAIEIANHFLGPPGNISDARIGIRGFGNIGCTIAKYLTNEGARIVAICDSECTIYEQKGIEIPPVSTRSFRDDKKTIIDLLDGKILSTEDFYELECDVLIITAGEFSPTEEEICSLQAKYVVEGNNNTIPKDIACMLHQRGVLILPSILTLAGSVIGSFAEINGISPERAFSLTQTKVTEITRTVVQDSFDSGRSIREVAEELAKEKLLDAMGN